jgi:hypothetical protein
MALAGPASACHRVTDILPLSDSINFCPFSVNFQNALEEPLPYPGLHMILQNEYVMPFKASSGQFPSLSLDLFGLF